jgi:multicomponent Na+:H+ antiporter subunit G
MSIFETVIFIVSWISMLAGSAFLIIGATGIIRFPDFWSRLHAAAVIDSAGTGLLLIGMMLQAGFTFVTVKLLLIGIFLLITGPTATHAVANAAYVSGSRPLGDKSGRPVVPAEVRDVAKTNDTIEERT